MGQQQRFDTLVLVAEGLLRQARDPKQVARAVRVQLGPEQLARIELTLDPEAGHDVHIYETYWAPLTEGRVQLADVMSFLLRAGVNGLAGSWRLKFPRWVFGRLHFYPLPFRNLLQLLVTLAVIVALMVINTMIVTIGASQLLPDVFPSSWPSPILVEAVSSLLNLELVAAALFGLSLSLCLVGRHRLLGLFQKVVFGALLLTTLLTAWDLVAVIVWDHASVLQRITAYERVRSVVAQGLGNHRHVQQGLWVLFVGASELVRRLLVQYVGDVAVYVSSHKLDRFEETRDAIRSRVCATAAAVYAARNPDGSFVYDSVAIVGHSLGAVVSYDCLNHLLNKDALAKPGEELEVLKRTELLLTFGSPLDKIAYIFGARDSHFLMRGRSALAATSQPLILSEEFSSIPWVNVYSPNDIISGELQLFGAPNDRRIENVVDERALTWIVAHTEYWKNEEVWKQLCAKLRAPREQAEASLRAAG